MKKLSNNKFLENFKMILIICVIFAIILSGCINKGQSNTETKPANNATLENSSGNQETSGEYLYGTATVETIQVMTQESFPVQIQVIAQGYLPDGCTEIDKVNTEREGNNFNINISTKRPKDAMCTQARVPFNKTIPLDVQGLKAGNYTVNVNGVKGSFELSVDNILSDSPGFMPPRQQVITEADNGKSISLRNGEIFYLRLKENPTTGYSWELNLSQGLNNISGNYYAPKTSNESQQPLVGAGGVHIWEIKATTEGSQQVKGIYKRPWEDITGKEDTFTLNVEVV